MRPTHLEFLPGEPLPAGKVNGLVGATVEVTEAATHEHSPDGLHIHIRFEMAMAVFARGKEGWSVEFGDRIGYLAPGGGGQVCTLDTSDAQPLHPLMGVGVIAYNEHGDEVPCSAPVIETPKEYHFGMYPPAGTDWIFVVAIARRRIEP